MIPSVGSPVLQIRATTVISTLMLSFSPEHWTTCIKANYETETDWFITLSVWAVWQVEKAYYLSQLGSESTVIKLHLEMTTEKKDSVPNMSPFE